MIEYTLLLASILLSIASVILATYSLLSLNRLKSRTELLMSALRSRSMRSYIKSLESSVKGRKRYLIVRFVVSGKELSKSHVQELLTKSYISLFGGRGLSLSGIKVVDYLEGERIAIIKFRSIEKWRLLTALGGLERICNGRVIPIPIKSCGTLRKAMEHVRKLKLR